MSRPDNRRRALLSRAAVCAASIAVAGCASLPSPAVPDRVHAGRFSVVVALDGQRDSASGRFTLSISGARAVLDLATPLGSTLARIERGPEGVLLRINGAGGTEERRGTDGTALTEALLGWPLPVDGMADWVAGRPAPGSTAQTDGVDPPRAFTQNGWRIEIAERFASGQPRQLLITRPAQPARDFAAASPAITLRLLIDDPSGGS
jgi:outer membrane lipoprotein LolB